MGATYRHLSKHECMDLLTSDSVGRLCIIDHDYPLAFPVNYRVTETAGLVRIVVRSTPRAAIASL